MDFAVAAIADELENDDMCAANWEVLCANCEVTPDQVFPEAIRLLEAFKQEDVAGHLRDRWNVLDREPMPQGLRGTPFESIVLGAVADTKERLSQLLNDELPVELESSSDGEDGEMLDEEYSDNGCVPDPPSPEQLLNAFAAMKAAVANSAEEAEIILSASSECHSIDRVTVTSGTSALRFVLCEVNAPEAGSIVSTASSGAPSTILRGTACDESTVPIELYCAFAGTDGWEEVVSQAHFQSRRSPIGRLHHGVAEQVRKLPLAPFEALARRGCRVFFVGHSLGGAVATAVTVELLCRYSHLAAQQNVMCVTAGAPLMGDSDVHRRSHWMGANQHLFHVLQDNDSIPRLLTFVGALKNPTNARVGTIKTWINHLARSVSNIAMPERDELVPAVVEEALQGLGSVEHYARMNIPTYVPAGRYCCLPSRGDGYPLWSDATTVDMTAPPNLQTLLALIKTHRSHQLARYHAVLCRILKDGVGEWPPRKVCSSMRWKSMVSGCSVSRSSTRQSCDVSGENLWFTCSVTVHEKQYKVSPGSILMGSRLVLEEERSDIDNDACGTAGQFVNVEAVSMLQGCSSQCSVVVPHSSICLRPYEQDIAALSPQQLLKQHLWASLLSSCDDEHLDEDLEPLLQLINCQPLESIFRVFVSDTPGATVALLECLGRIRNTQGGLDQLVRDGISQNMLCTLREAFRMRKEESEARSKSILDVKRLNAGVVACGANAIGESGMTAKNSASVLQSVSAQFEAAQRHAKQAVAAKRASKEALQAAKLTLKQVKSAASGDKPGSVARTFHKHARQSARSIKRARQALPKAQQQLRSARAAVSQAKAAVSEAKAAAAVQEAALASAEARASASAWNLAADVGTAMLAVSVLVALSEAYSLHYASQMADEKYSFKSRITKTPTRETDDASCGGGDYSFDRFDMGVLDGAQAADELIAIVMREAPFFPPPSVSKTLGMLEYTVANEPGRYANDALALRRVLRDQRRELEEVHQLLRYGAAQGLDMASHRDKLNLRCSAVMSIHTYWVGFIVALLSGPTGVTLQRGWCESALWSLKYLFLDTLQPVSLAIKMTACGRAATQQAAQNFRDCYTEELGAASWEERVAHLYEGISGASNEHSFQHIRLYSQLHAIRANLPDEVSWRSDPIKLAEQWDTLIAPRLVPGKNLSRVSESSRLEVMSWLVSALSLLEIYERRLQARTIGLMGVTAACKSSFTAKIATQREHVVRGGLAVHRTSMPSMYRCRPHPDDELQREFSVIDFPGLTDKEYGDAGEGVEVPAMKFGRIVPLCPYIAIFVPHRLSYVSLLQEQLTELTRERQMSPSNVLVCITKCEDAISSALDAGENGPVRMAEELEKEVDRLGLPHLIQVVNTHFAVIDNPLGFSAEQLNKLGVWTHLDMWRWMANRSHEDD